MTGKSKKHILFDLLKRPEGVTYEQFFEVKPVKKNHFLSMLVRFRKDEELPIRRKGKVYTTDPDAKLKQRKNAKAIKTSKKELKPDDPLTFCVISKCPEDGSNLRLVRDANVCFQCFKEGRV